MTNAKQTTIKGATVKGAPKGKRAPKGAPVAALVVVDTVVADTVVAPADTAPAETFTTLFVQALTARNAEQFSKDTETAINTARKSAKSLNAVMSDGAFAEIAPSLVRSARIASVKQDKAGFIAVKVLVKIVQALSALINGKGEFDPYTRCIATNMLSANGLSNKSALVSLSKSITYDALDTEQMLKSHYDCSAGTACTQASSTRMMLKHIGVCEVSKGKRGDVITLSDNARAVQFAGLFVTAK